MYKSLLCSCFLLLSVFFFQRTYGQSFTALYTFSGVTTSSGTTDPTSVPVATGVTFGSFRMVGNPTPNANPNAAGRFSFQNWPVTSAISLSEYYEVIIAPKVNYALTLNMLTFTVQRSATGIKQFSVRSSNDNYSSNLPASFTGSQFTVDADNVFKVVAPTATTTAVANCIITINTINNSTSPDTLRFYAWDAGAAGGTFSLNRVEVAGAATAASGTPVLTLDTNLIRFPSVPPNTTSPSLQYMVKGNDLSGPVTVTTSAPFLVSDAANGIYGTSVTLPAQDVATPKAVFVKFTPTSVGAFMGSLTNSSTGATSLNVTLNGQGIDPANLNFSFNTCTALGIPAGGFIPYSVTGAQVFACTQFGHPRDGTTTNTNGVDMNGYSGGPVENEDWLISPPLSIGNLTTPILSFYSRVEYAGPFLQLLVSTDYDGYSNPNNFTWTDMQAGFPTVNTWTLTDGINLSVYKSAPKLYFAFKYLSSPDINAARWTLDDISVTDRSKLFTTIATALNFGEAPLGSQSSSQAFSIKGFGYGDLMAAAPVGYLLSLDNNSFSSSIQIADSSFFKGMTIYVRFSPQTKSLKIEGKIHFTGNNLDSSLVALKGSSYLRAETFDVGAYNLSFFGSNSTNHPTPGKISEQINNIATVFQHINLDIIGVEEVSSDSAIGVLISKLPGYAAVLSNRWSYSFNGYDAAFPPQKVGFIYDTSTAQLVEQRVMFEGLFDSLRTNKATLPGYPDSVSHFWSSGRLPFMATFNVALGGITKRVRIIDIHAKSSSDVNSYNRRVYDVKVLKDSLDAYYRDDNVILVGDYNDRVYGSIYAGGISPYRIFVNDIANYSALDYPLDSAGRVSFITGTGLIDHIIISNELRKNYISGSTDIEDARTYIKLYNDSTASDHLPIFTRMTLTEQGSLPVKLTRFNAASESHTVLLNWRTEQENNNDHFVIERSGDGRNFSEIAIVPGSGTSTLPHTYQSIDSFPLTGINYYRLRQVDADGKATVSNTVAVNMAQDAGRLSIYPNPVLNYLQIQGASTSITDYTARITTTDGKVLLQTKGTANLISQFINQQLGKLKPGMYIFYLRSSSGQQSIKFIKQ